MIGPSIGPAIGPSIVSAIEPSIGPAIGPSIGPQIGVIGQETKQEETIAGLQGLLQSRFFPYSLLAYVCVPVLILFWRCCRSHVCAHSAFIHGLTYLFDIAVVFCYVSDLLILCFILCSCSVCSLMDLVLFHGIVA